MVILVSKNNSDAHLFVRFHTHKYHNRKMLVMKPIKIYILQKMLKKLVSVQITETKCNINIFIIKSYKKYR